MRSLLGRDVHAYTHLALTLPASFPLAGNGKTLRTERAMAAFVKGWITMSGPSSAKAGMQGTPCPIAILSHSTQVLTRILVFRHTGNSDSSNGCNCIYDEASALSTSSPQLRP